MLSLENIIEYYTNPDPRIKTAREYSDKLNLHVNGVGLETALEQINNYENTAQKVARDKFAISNKFITDRLLRPTDNVFSAKGGFTKYLFSTKEEELQKEFSEKLKDVYSGYSLSQYIHRIWFDKFIVDPNGLIYMEVGEDGDEIYPCYKSIHSIRNYHQDGIKCPWVIFEPDITIFDEERIKDVKEEWFWAVDEQFYYRCVKTKDKDNKETVAITEYRPHLFGQVPAVICSDIEDHVTGWKKSAIDQQVELLNKFMVDNSVLNIVDFMHSYPQQWVYVDDCNKCHGTGQVANTRVDRNGDIDTNCPSCSGTGKHKRKDVTDIIELKPPGESEQKIDPPSGYIYMPVDAWKLKVASVDRTWDQIMFSQWGAVMEYGSQDGNQYATATGRWTDTQPVNNKLNRYTESVELIDNALTELYGRFFYPETFVKSCKVYGRRYLIETPDQLLARLGTLSNLSGDPMIIAITFDQYLESEFRDNEDMYAYNKKIASLDPFPHIKLADLASLGLPPEQLHKKLYVVEYKNSKSIQFVLDPKNDIKKDYEQYIKDKQLIMIPPKPVVEKVEATDKSIINE